MHFNRILLSLFVLSSIARATEIRHHLEIGTSVSRHYDGRSIFINPASLGYQSLLNGFDPLSSFNLTLNQNKINEVSVGLAYGYFGIGAEKRAVGTNEFGRYSLGVGFPITPSLFMGGRFSFTSANTAGFNNIQSWDIGLQYRAFRFVSFGYLGESLNSPTSNGQPLTPLHHFGATLRPVDSLSIQLDVSTMEPNFGRRWDYEAIAQFEVARGISIYGGYHKTESFQFGVNINMALGSYTVISRPDSGNRVTSIAVQSSRKPYQSVLNPSSTFRTILPTDIDEKGARNGIFSSERTPFASYLRQLESLKEDPDVQKVFIEIKGFNLGMAAAEEYRDRIEELREAGKIVHVALANCGIKEYLIASAANSISIEPSATLEFPGLKQSRYFFKGTLDKLGIKAELLAKGKYKSAPESFTRTSSSPTHRQATLENLEVAEKALIQKISKYRKEATGKWGELHERVLFSAKEAKEYGLVNLVAPSVKLRKELEKGTWIRTQVGWQKDELQLPSRVSVIIAEGNITNSSGGLLSFGGMNSITPARIKEDFDAALADPRTEAIVLRISSGGGEVLASQEIATIIEQADEQKPVFVSMGDVAASGGYMMAVPGRKIFAKDLAVTGSIGVFLGKANLKGLYEKIGVTKETISKYPLSSLYSEAEALTPEARKILLRHLDHYYDYFTGYVASQRGMTKAKVESAAQGRVWMGSTAKANGLVDQNGGLIDTVRYASDEVGLRNYEMSVVDTRDSLFNFLGNQPVFASAPTGLKTLFSLFSDLPESGKYLYYSPVQRLE